MLQKLEIHFTTLCETSMVTTAKNSKNAVKIYDSVWWSYHLMKDEKRGSDNSQRVSNRNNKGKH